MIRRLRLISGLVMFVYVTTHLVNHSLGLISVRAMDLALERIYEYWASPLGGFILYGAFAIHYSLALWALWLRRSLKMPFAEATQLVLGFSIPFMLTDHVLQTRVADKFFDANYGYYSTLLYAYFVANPPRGVVQLVVLLVAWIHAMIGLRFWLRLKPWYERWQPILYAFALLLPTFAILGVFEGGRQVMILAEDPAWVARLVEEHPRPAGADAAFLERMVVGLRFGFLAALLAVLAARIARSRWERRRGVIRMTYPSGRVVEILHGVSALEASRMAGIPHASVCGGRGRCSTCRIKVEGPVEALPPPAADEVKVLHRVGAAPDVRLACQLRPQGDLRVTPLLPATAQARDGFARPGYLHGAEREIAIDWAELSPSTAQYVVAFLRDRGVHPVTAQTAPAPTPGVSASLRALEQQLLRVTPTSATGAAHRRATTALAELRKLSASWPAESPRDYNVNLAEDVRALTAVIERGDQARLSETLESVADDLETKLEHCRKSGGKLGGSVVVRVRTIKGSEETKSWQILYIPKILEVSQTATPDVFPQFSSPSEELLVPGRYVMWARLPGTSRVGERTVVKVGEGRKELLVDLPVPLDTVR